jgi:hypothetical protein
MENHDTFNLTARPFNQGESVDAYEESPYFQPNSISSFASKEVISA